MGMPAGDARARRLSVWQSATAGGTAGVVSRFVIAPFDVIKIRFQLQLEPIRRRRRLRRGDPVPKYRGLLQAVGAIVREEGVRALWKGNLAAEFLYVTYGATQFAVYDVLSRAAEKHVPAHIHSGALVSFVTGGTAGATATLVSYPLDILRTRMAAQGEPKLYPNLATAIRHMWASEGLRGFYRGCVPALFQIFPYMGLQFATYGAFKSAAVTMRRAAGKETTLISAELLLCGGAAGTLSKLAVLPIDMVKKRLQVQGFEGARASFGRTERYSGPWHCLVTIVRQEGLAALFKGATPSILKAAPASAVTFVVYEGVKRWFLGTPRDVT